MTSFKNLPGDAFTNNVERKARPHHEGGREGETQRGRVHADMRDCGTCVSVSSPCKLLPFDMRAVKDSTPMRSMLV